MSTHSPMNGKNKWHDKKKNILAVAIRSETEGEERQRARGSKSEQHESTE